jgi:hypothetical protein
MDRVPWRTTIKKRFPLPRKFLNTTAYNFYVEDKVKSWELLPIK